MIKQTFSKGLVGPEQTGSLRGTTATAIVAPACVSELTISGRFLDADLAVVVCARSVLLSEVVTRSRGKGSAEDKNNVLDGNSTGATAFVIVLFASVGPNSIEPKLHSHLMNRLRLSTMFVCVLGKKKLEPSNARGSFTTIDRPG